jgi:hypothetical protein
MRDMDTVTRKISGERVRFLFYLYTTMYRGGSFKLVSLSNPLYAHSDVEEWELISRRDTEV